MHLEYHAMSPCHHVTTSPCHHVTIPVLLMLLLLSSHLHSLLGTVYFAGIISELQTIDCN